MKRLLLFLLVLLLPGCETIRERATWASYPGAFKHGQCATYALAVVSDLHQRGIEAYYVEFDWSGNRDYGTHAVCLFRQAGQWSVVDNQQPYPFRLTSANDLLILIRPAFPEAERIRACDPEFKL